jgi:protein-L-isoaspartate(D-aspartate) O-methyltransferase
VRELTRVDPQVLRERMVDDLIAQRWIRTEAVAAAMRRVPRHLFTPAVPPEVAYGPDAVVIKRDPSGAALSSVSAPSIVAMMLEQATPRRGLRILEIGSGGYNAALLAELVGRSGHVTTVDIDPEVTARARACLIAADYRRVLVDVADAEYAYPAQAPYDRILVTVQAADVSPAWERQLTHTGTITVPLRINGLTRSVTLARAGGHWEAISALMCGFVPIQGAGVHVEQRLPLDSDSVERVGVRFDHQRLLDSRQLVGVLDTGRVQVWSAVTVARMEPFDSLHLWLATTLSTRFGLLYAPADDARLVLQNPRACPAIVHESSLAYLTLRRTAEGGGEFGAVGQGRYAAELAEVLLAAIHRWHREHRGRPGPRISVYPTTVPVTPPPLGCVLARRHTQVVVSWTTHDPCGPPP